MIYIIINGSGGTGKDSFCEECGNELRKRGLSFFNYSTIDYVCNIAKYLGWDGVKDEKGRRLLSDLKDALIRYNDSPFKVIIEKISMFNKLHIESYRFSPKGIGFIHCREKTEIDKLVKALGARTLLIFNKNVPEITSNASDAQAAKLEYDYTIDNSGSLEDLKLLIPSFVDLILKEPQ